MSEIVTSKCLGCGGPVNHLEGRPPLCATVSPYGWQEAAAHWKTVRESVRSRVHREALDAFFADQT